MNYINKITWSLMLCTAFFASCSDNDEPGTPAGLTVDKEEITVGPEGGTEQISISAPDNWVASAREPWIMVSPANGTGTAVGTIMVDSTLENSARSTELRFRASNGQSKIVTVTQFGYGKQIVLKEAEVEIKNSDSYNNRTFESTISANIPCQIKKVEYSFEDATPDEAAAAESDRSDWLLNERNQNTLAGTDLGIELDRKARPRTVKFRFRWNMNVAPYTRVAKVYLAPTNPEQDQLVDDDGNPIEHVILTIKQKAAQKITDDRAGDSIAVLTINEKIQSMIAFDSSENLQNWDNITLWEANDKDLPSEEAIGRIRSVRFSMFNLQDGESLPKEIRHLKYLESFYIASNDNNQIRTIDMGNEICNLEHLKELSIIAVGITELPTDFVKLGAKLEKLDLSNANFTSLNELTTVINSDNFPHLKELVLIGQRRSDTVIDLQSVKDNQYQSNGRPIGMHINLTSDTREKEAFLSLLTWDALRTLELSYCFIEGTLPTDEEVVAALKADAKEPYYTEADFSDDSSEYLDKLVGDTCRWLLTTNNPVTCKKKDGSIITDSEGNEMIVRGQEVPRVLPKARIFSINLNFFTGTLPRWILFHPHLVGWNPVSMVFNQQEKGKDSEGRTVGFSNIDADNFDYTYYYGHQAPEGSTVQGVAYPLYYRVYVSESN